MNSEIRNLTVDELDAVTGAFLGALLANLAAQERARQAALGGCSCEL
jgi:hypothetical protein